MVFGNNVEICHQRVVFGVSRITMPIPHFGELLVNLHAPGNLFADLIHKILCFVRNKCPNKLGDFFTTA